MAARALTSPLHQPAQEHIAHLIELVERKRAEPPPSNWTDGGCLNLSPAHTGSTTLTTLMNGTGLDGGHRHRVTPYKQCAALVPRHHASS